VTGRFSIIHFGEQTYFSPQIRTTVFFLEVLLSAFTDSPKFILKILYSVLKNEGIYVNNDNINVYALIKLNTQKQVASGTNVFLVLEIAPIRGH
jgi:hypothetical protein